MQASFAADPKAAAKELMAHLSPAERSVLLEVLARSSLPGGNLDAKYLEELFNTSDTKLPKGVLDK